MNEKLYHSILVLTILICPIFSQKVINSSLIFVIDRTSSMSKDIKNVLKSADGLFDAVVNSNQSDVDNFIIVTFGDPGFEVRIITDKRDEFKSSLRSLRAKGGDDCPEMAMSGIELGLQRGRPYSYLIVFTDAAAKDMEKFERVRNLALELNTKIIFLVTKWKCPNQENVDFSAYEKLARDTGGEFFFLNKDNLPEIMKYVMKLVDSRKVEILKKQFNATDDNKVVKVSLDPSIDNVLMSVTGGESTVDVKDKDNATVATEGIATIKDTRVVSWNNTNPGDYTVEINSTTNTLLTIHGTTKVSFSYGFSVIRPSYFNETTNRPVADQKSYILIKINNEGEKINLQSLLVVDLKDNILLDKLKIVSQGDSYIAEPIDLPKDTFKIVMVAEDEKTKDVIKRASLPIEPQKVLPGTMKTEAPVVTILGETKITTSTGNPLQIKCRVTGNPKPKISWEDAFGTTLTSTVSTVREEYEYLSMLNIDKVQRSIAYICKASNNISSDEKSVEVETGDRFAVVQISKDQKIEYHKEGKLYCKVNADPPANVFWYLNGNPIETNDDFDISPDKSTLTIKKMKNNYVGTVLCEVRNSAKRVMYNMKLSTIGPERPEIDKNITEIFAIEGSSANVSCRILKGNPKPIIKWSFKSKNNVTFYDINENKEDIRIENITSNEVGTYKCVAKNDIAEDSHILDLTIEYAPIVLGQSNVDINQQIGQNILISCDIKGEPEPIISWFFNGLMIVESKYYHINKDNALIFDASIATMGEYSCTGVNKLGSVEKTANVSVFEPLKIDTGANIQIINIEAGRQLSLSCPIKGYPPPKIRWSFLSINLTDPRNLSSNVQLAQIPEVKTSDSGFYTCTVVDSGDTKAFMFSVNVIEPIKSTVRKINAVDGDKFLRLSCKSAAEPKSTISWFKNDAPITIGNEWHSLESDGSLLVKGVKTTTAGIYDCATRDRSKVFESYEVNISMYPDVRNRDYSIEYFIENENGTVPCKVSEENNDYVRWYKKKTVVRFGKNINLDPYNKRKHEGKYVCRANNLFVSKNDGVDIKTGSIPKFQFVKETLIENVLFDQAPDLNCANSGQPKAEVLWWKNDIRMNYNDMTYFVNNKVSDRGKYRCVAKNKFGNVSRQFTVTANDCLLNIGTDFDIYHPLILTESYELPDFYIKDEHVAIPINTTVQFYCEGGFNRFIDESVRATCREGQTFEINREIIEYRKLKCKKALQPVTVQTVDCVRGEGKLFQIGLSVKDFIEVYRICFDKKFRFLYTEHNIKPWAADVSATGMQTEKWFHSDVINYNNNEMYDCKRQKDGISAIIGQALQGNDDECYVARQLINEKDVPPGFPQLFTHSYLNIIPHWNSDATRLDTFTRS
ncbi:PREDICTED: hemicentin-2-like [Papilio xuthus]|uniref:Hemicentin-2-like n=1 Tax=Papilio xuthus TaxID=66420 RepID=A0AAJ7EC31_PAPXU|nr:PREDICTED: hemicentin-2-like [Papilio xuthus]